MKTFEELCKDNYPLIFRYILGNVRNQEHAQDLVQEVFLIAYKKGEEFENHEKPVAFLYVTAKNLVLAHFRKVKREIPTELDESISNDAGDLFNQLCQIHEDSIESEKYKNEVLNHLPEKDQQLYNKYYTENKSMKDIAKTMGVSETSIRMRYVRLRKKVKNIVRDMKLGEF